jgi:hypothetical protein
VIHIAYELVAMLPDRVNESLVRLGRLDLGMADRPAGGHAAFCHPAPGGGRFNSEALGSWYCATGIETAIAETVYHHTKRLAHSASGFRHVIQMRELLSEVDAEVYDIRAVRESHPELYGPESSRLPSLLGRRCGEPGRVV